MNDRPRTPPRWCWVALVGGFAASRVLAAATGVSFDATSLGYGWQILDPELLRTRLLESVFYLHAQPPLFNLFVGTVLKIAGAHAESAFAALYHTVGLGLHAVVLALLLRVGLRPGIATVATLVLACAPAAILYESWLFYEYPLAAILVAAAWWLGRTVDRRKTSDAVILGLLLTAACWTRSLFHLVWLVAILAATLAFARGDRRRLMAAFAPAVLLVVLLYGKNAALFGFFGTSSWLGMSLCRMSTERLDPEIRSALEAEGDLSPLASIRPYSPPARYPEDVRRDAPWPVPALTQEFKSTGPVNFNLYAYVGISRIYLRDALTSIERAPGTYARSVGLAWLRFFMPPTQYWILDANRAAIRGLERAYDLAQGVVGSEVAAARNGAIEPAGSMAARGTWLTVVLAFASLAWFVVTIVPMSKIPEQRGKAAILAFCAFNVVWVPCLANALELGENNRFRVLVEPLAFVLVMAFAREVVTRRLGRGPRGGDGR